MGKEKKHILICQGCFKSTDDKGMKKEMFFLTNEGTYYSVHCIDCVQEYGLEIIKPYYKERKKKTDK